ncbi:MAG TPA: SCP2 sterol-binding domain-containing protein [Moraxellaceae bacterium]|nr:SCP2 sterol-binding domain-containing protein [Moraxellaceae bacterium]
MQVRMMAGFDNSTPPGSDDRQLGRYLWLGAIETLINAFIDLDEPTREQVHALSGLVVRVKVLDPYLPFYLVFTQEGIEVSESAPTPAQVRINARLFDLMRTLLGASPLTASGRPRVRVWGEAASVARLETLLTDYNLRTRAQQWVRDHLNLEQLWHKIRNHDPSWLRDFLPLPGLMRETLAEIRLVNQNLLRQQQEFDAYRALARRQRVQDLLFLSTAFVALLVALGGELQVHRLGDLQSGQVLLLVMAALLLVSRLRA